MRETIKDNRGMKIGSYESFLNGKTIVYDKNGAKLGESRPEGNSFSWPITRMVLRWQNGGRRMTALTTRIIESLARVICFLACTLINVA